MQHIDFDPLAYATRCVEALTDQLEANVKLITEIRRLQRYIEGVELNDHIPGEDKPNEQN